MDWLPELCNCSTLSNVASNDRANVLLLFFLFVFLKVWRALLKEMPLQSLLRILGKMTSNKILEPGSSDTQAVCDRIQSETALKKVGPVQVAN